MRSSTVWALAHLVLLLALGCAGSGPYVWVTALPVTELMAPGGMRPGDKIQVVVFGQDPLSGEFEIRPGGNVVVPVAGSIVAIGKTPEQLAAEIAARLQGALASPRVTVVVSSRRLTGVSVMGEVRTPGRFELADGEGVLHALARAGGLSEYADDEAVFVIRPETGKRIRFRYADLTAARPPSSTFQLRNGDVVVVE